MRERPSCHMPWPPAEPVRLPARRSIRHRNRARSRRRSPGDLAGSAPLAGLQTLLAACQSPPLLHRGYAVEPRLRCGVAYGSLRWPRNGPSPSSVPPRCGAPALLDLLLGERDVTLQDEEPLGIAEWDPQAVRSLSQI